MCYAEHIPLPQEIYIVIIIYSETIGLLFTWVPDVKGH